MTDAKILAQGVRGQISWAFYQMIKDLPQDCEPMPHEELWQAGQKDEWFMRSIMDILKKK